VKLQLDDKTGEKVSKNELKRRLQKRAKPVLGSRLKPVVEGPEPAVEPVDHDAMFSRGLLAEIYRLRPSAHVVTRFPPEPEPNGYLHV
jgi:glutaminyl-tRNA synthetase